MGKRHVISVGAVVVMEEGRGPIAARRQVDDNGGSDRESNHATAEVPPDEVNEHLTRDLARVRAKFSMDAPPGEPWLKTAWMSEAPLEEYEAEFVDAVADCLGAGMSLQDALTCWDTGDLMAPPEEEPDGASADDEPALVEVVPAPPRLPTTGHRVLVR